MRLSRIFVLASTALVVTQALPALAQTPDWVARCRLVLIDDAKPESGKYFFQTRGKVDGAVARAELDYKTSISARAAIYPTDARDLLNPYSNLSLSIGYVAPGHGKSKPAVGHVSMGAIGKDFSAIPGAPITMKLVIDDVAFGPFQPAPVSSGMYSVWLDTADTDGDSKPPALSPADFDKLTKAVENMKSAELILVRDKTDLVRATIPSPQLAAWRDGLAAWAAKTNPGVGAATLCSGGGDVLN